MCNSHNNQFSRSILGPICVVSFLNGPNLVRKVDPRMVANKKKIWWNIFLFRKILSQTFSFQSVFCLLNDNSNFKFSIKGKGSLSLNISFVSLKTLLLLQWEEYNFFLIFEGNQFISKVIFFKLSYTQPVDIQGVRHRHPCSIQSSIFYETSLPWKCAQLSNQTSSNPSLHIRIWELQLVNITTMVNEV